MIDDIKKFSLGRKMYPSGIINFNKNNFNEKNKGKSNLGSERVAVNFTVLYLGYENNILKESQLFYQRFTTAQRHHFSEYI